MQVSSCKFCKIETEVIYKEAGEYMYMFCKLCKAQMFYLKNEGSVDIPEVLTRGNRKIKNDFTPD